MIFPLLASDEWTPKAITQLVTSLGALVAGITAGAIGVLAAWKSAKAEMKADAQAERLDRQSGMLGSQQKQIVDLAKSMPPTPSPPTPPPAGQRGNGATEA